MDDNTSTPNSTNGDNAKDAENQSLQDEIDRLTKDKKALQSEFNNAAPTDAVSLIKDAAIKAAPDAFQEIANLAAYAESESVRANCNKYIIEVASGRLDSGDESGDSLKAFLKDLKKPAGKSDKNTKPASPPANPSNKSR